MAAFKDLTGLTFGKWLVLRHSHTAYATQFWFCKCDCGTEKVVNGTSLKKGLSTSCGCTAKDWCRTHGMERTIEYNTWAQMKQRCSNPSSRLYKNYGGRGIKVCERWINSFENFYADMGDKPEGHSIERIDVDGDYEPSNCKWIPRGRQLINKRNTVYLTYLGETKPLAEWAEIKGIKRKVLAWRLKHGWPLERALKP